MAELEEFTHSRLLFTTDMGPMRFYVRPGPLKRQLSPIIAHGGGIMCRVQEPGAFLLAEPQQAQVRGLQYISSAYITDCARANRRLSTRSYRLHNRHGAAPDRKESPGKEPRTVAPREEHLEATAASCNRTPNKGGSSPTGRLSGPRHHSCSPRTRASCDQSPNKEGSREAEGHRTLGISPAGRGACPHNHTSFTGSPSLCDPTPTIGRSAVKKAKPGAEQITESKRDDFSEMPTTSMGKHGACSPREVRAERKEASERQLAPGECRLDHQTSGPGRKTPFSRQEDITILRYVQENEDPKKLVTGTLFWKELEKKRLLKRSWQSMKCRYTKYILPRKHHYRLPPKGAVQMAAIIPRSVVNQCGGPSSVVNALGPPSAETSLKNPHPPDDLPHAADTLQGACTNFIPEDISCPGGSAVSRQLKCANFTSDKEEGNTVSVAASKEMSILQENQDDNLEDLQIFEIANMEFEVDEDFCCKATVPGISLKDFVMNEDSMSVNTPVQMDDVTFSLGFSNCDGLQEALNDLMKEFNLDICQITQALLKNNGEVGSTRHFLRTDLRPDGFPIWSHQDDEDLQSNDPTVQGRLAKKYGADNVAKRTAFLSC